MCQYNFATAELDEFGELYIDLAIAQENITSHSAELNFNINSTVNKTNKELIGLLTNVTVEILKGTEIKDEITLSENQLNQLKNNGIINIRLTDLESDTTYQVAIKGRIEAGNTKKDLVAIINGDKRFETLKEEAIVSIKNLFVIRSLIDFDIKIYDKDGAIRDREAILEIIDTRGELVKRQEIIISRNVDDEYIRINTSNLSENEKYYFVLKVNNYSIRNEEATITEKYFEFTGNEQRIKGTIYKDNNAGIIYTNTVGGNISLSSVKRENTDISGNLIDVESEVNWYSQCFNTNKGYLKQYNSESQVLRLGVGTSTSQIYIYDLLESYAQYNQDELEMSFKYKKSNPDLKIYIQIGKNFETDKIFELNEEGVLEDEEGYYIFDSKNFIAGLKTKRFIGLLLQGAENSYVDIKEFQVKLSSDEAFEDEEEESGYKYYRYILKSNFKLNLNLYDERYNNTNVTDGVYYLKLKNLTNGDFVENKYIEYDFEAMNDSGEDTSKIENYIKGLELAENKEYEIDLILKHPDIEEREYILNTIQVNTKNKEIKNIENINQYLEIQPNGSYVFSNDLNLDTGDYRFGNSGIIFGGNLDFNGKKISRTIT